MAGGALLLLAMAAIPLLAIAARSTEGGWLALEIDDAALEQDPLYDEELWRGP